MTLKECYECFGGDFESVLTRLQREQLVEKFAVKFLDDKSFDLFVDSMKNKDYGEAMRAVHTLKGICLNLSFTRLFESSNSTTQALKANDTVKAAALMKQLTEDYNLVIETIRSYQRCKEN